MGTYVIEEYLSENKSGWLQLKHSHAVTNLQQLYFMLEMMKRLGDCSVQQCTG